MPASPSRSSSRPNSRAQRPLTEAAVIDCAARLFGAGATPARGVLRGIGDDTAVLAPAPRGALQLFTMDALACGTHFTASDPPQAVGWKAIAVNISDIAAMGGTPFCAVVSLGVPPRTPRRYADGILRGMQHAARAFTLAIVGGDTIRADVITISVAMLGYTRRTQLCLRSGARPGDLIAVTGPLGASLCTGRHLRFTPRLAEAHWLVAHAKPSAMMDLSDGLAMDAARMATASNVSLLLSSQSIPRHRGASLHAALHDGEDFELLCTFSPRVLTARCQANYRRRFHTPLVVIGRVASGPPRVFLDHHPLQPAGFDHFPVTP